MRLVSTLAVVAVACVLPLLAAAQSPVPSSMEKAPTPNVKPVEPASDAPTPAAKPKKAKRPTDVKSADDTPPPGGLSTYPGPTRTGKPTSPIGAQ